MESHRELELLSKINPLSITHSSISDDVVMKESSSVTLQLSIGLQPAPRTYKSREKLLKVAKPPSHLMDSHRTRPHISFDLNEKRRVVHPSRFRRDGMAMGDGLAVDDIISGVKRKVEEARRETEESVREAEAMKEEAREEMRLAEERKERARRQIEQAQYELAIAKQIREQAKEEMSKAEAMREKIRNSNNYLCPCCNHHPLHADSTNPHCNGTSVSTSSAIQAPAWQPDNPQQQPQGASSRHHDHASFQLQ